MPALEWLVGVRVVALASALDGARWRGEVDRDVLVVRFAPDEAFGIGATAVEVDDPEAIVVSEAGFVGARLTAVELADVIGHIDWPLPRDGASGVLAQGKIGGVPAKLWIGAAGDRPLLVTQAAYAHELADRLGWLR